ncbi:MAG TPA: precorrin-8X methylmutase [Ruminococcaceae bacterium]|nr:precorrin-8X methylmutase [Oscillospiraceae bacterium]
MEPVITNLLPDEIEKRSFEIITSELGSTVFPQDNEAVIKRVIHTTADFEYVNNLCFSENAVKIGVEALKNGAGIITDTQMALAGISKPALAKLNISARCFISDADVAQMAKESRTTRSAVCMDKAASLEGNFIIAVGNAPTALIRLYQLIKDGRIKPKLIIGVPVGFVNVVESKELIMQAGMPYIVARGRKGGSNVAAAICNALLYLATERKL